MPNQRRKGQTFVGCQVDERLLRELDSGRGRQDRSQFIREAIAEKLEQLGIEVPEDLIYPPQRSGVVVVAEQSGTNNTQNISSSAGAKKRAHYKKSATKKKGKS